MSHKKLDIVDVIKVLKNGSHYLENIQSSGGRALFRSYGRCFAEFLKDLSLVRLGLLDLNTCVGLRYGYYKLKLRSFSR